MTRDQIDRILERTDILELIRPHVALRKVGKDYVGLCPFHTDSKPSFNVVVSDQFYYCFGCLASGNAISWLRQRERMSFDDAVFKLAAQAGIQFEDGTLAQELKLGQQYAQQTDEDLLTLEIGILYLALNQPDALSPDDRKRVDTARHRITNGLEMVYPVHRGEVPPARREKERAGRRQDLGKGEAAACSLAQEEIRQDLRILWDCLRRRTASRQAGQPLRDAALWVAPFPQTAWDREIEAATAVYKHLRAAL